MAAPRTPEFRRWFRASKIVDAHGEPLVVYHGGFDVLNSRAGAFRRSTSGALGAGIYFTPDRSVAEYYAGSQGGHAETGGGALTEVYLSIQNPLVVDHTQGRDPAIEALVLLGEPRARAEAKVERARERSGDVGKTIETAAVKADYDGIIHSIDGEVYEIVAFQPGQVKSATRNAGTYEFFDADIRRNPASGLDVRPGIPGTYRTTFTDKGGRERAYPAHGGAAWDNTLVRVANETTVESGRVYDTVKHAEHAGHASLRGKRGEVAVTRLTNPDAFGPFKPLIPGYRYRVKQNSNGDTLIAVFHGSKRVAHIDAYWEYSTRGVEDREEENRRRGRGVTCATDLRSLGAGGKYPNVLAVSHAFITDDAHKGKGVGRAMYQAMMVEGFAVRESRIGGKPGPMFFIPDECSGAGNTSAEARRVWASLVREYPSAGTSIRVDAPPVIGSRPAPVPATPFDALHAAAGTALRAWMDTHRDEIERRMNAPAPVRDLTTTPEFEAWFGNSKMIDENGKPQRLYHMTAAEFTEFKPGGHDPSLSGRVIYLTPYPHDIPAGHNVRGTVSGERYRPGTNVMPVYASIQRPLYILDADDAQYAQQFRLDSFGFPKSVSDKSLAALKAAGYDGIVYGAYNEAARFDIRTGRNVEIIAFYPTQIKSATGNRGTFDPQDPDIRHNPRRR